MPSSSEGDRDRGPEPVGDLVGGPDHPGSQSSVLARLELEELEEKLQRARRKERRHLLWTLLGFSPAAVLPALGLLREGSIGLLFLLAVLVTVSEGVAWARASRKAERLEEQCRARRAEWVGPRPPRRSCDKRDVDSANVE